MCETKTVLVSPSIILVVAPSCWIYQRKHCEIKNQSPRGYEYKDFCLNGECYCVVDDDILGCNCSWLYGRKRGENYMWSLVRFEHQKGLSFLLQNLTRSQIFN